MYKNNEATLQQVLDARDRRREEQLYLIRTYSCPVISFTMNIAGGVKRSPLIELAFDYGLSLVSDRFPPPIHFEQLRDIAGCEALWVYDLPAEYIKMICEEVESAENIGRLFDLDVLNTDGSKLSRRIPRSCLICGGPAFFCSSTRAHDLDAVKTRIHRLLSDYAVEYLSGLAVDSLKEETYLTQRPELHCENDTCRNMGLSEFLRNVESLRSYFRKAVHLGIQNGVGCMPQLQPVILEMLSAAEDINADLGAVYSLNLFLAALGSRLSYGDDLFRSADTLAKQWTSFPYNKNGNAFFSSCEILSAQQEAEAGFPRCTLPLALAVFLQKTEALWNKDPS